MSGRLSRLTLTLAVLAAVLSGLASTSQSTDPVIGPYYEDPTEAELAFYDAEYPCPPIDGLENTGRTVNVMGEVSIRCDYTQADVNRQQTLNVKWLKPDYDSYATYLCEDVPDRQADDSFIRDTVLATTPNAIRGEYSLSNAPELEPAFQAATQALLSATTPLSRGCAEPPTTLDCPEVPGHALGFADDADDIQPDTFAQDCSYESSSPEKGDSFKIDVWWAAQGGVPALRDRLCSEIPTEGVGVGVLTAPGTAVRATYWRFSPLEGPDVEVVRGAAQALLDQAAPIAADCEGAATVPATSTEFPDYLADAFVPALIGAPAGGGGGLDSLPTAAPAAASADDGSLLKTLIRIGNVVMFALSMLGLFITFLMVKRESRIRERRDMLRIAITMGVAIISALILGRDAPLWAILVGVGLGVAVGTWQGSTLLVRSTERGLVAKRSLVGIVAFAVGILLMQAAGFLNRTGGLTLGVAVSFLSAALTAGLFVGRKPRMMQALGNATRVLLPLALIVGLLAGFGAAVGEAQTGPAPGTCPPAGFYLDLSQCEGYENLLDVVPWDSAFVSGGLWWDDGKPPIEVSLPRGLATAPEPASQTASWSSTESSGATLDFTIEETYTFGLLPDGLCCTVSYDATGTRTRTPVDGEPTVETYVVAGRLDDIHVVGRVGLGSNLPFGIPFTEKLQLRGYPEDSCQRIVAQRQDDNTEGAATWDTLTINGEDRGYVSSEINVFIDCDLPDFTYENALALAAPVPSAADPVRVVGGGFGTDGEICPVRQEFARYMWDAGMFEGVQTLTLGELFLEPNTPQCDYGGLFSPPAFGGGGRGDTRHEIIYRLAIQNDPVAEAARLADDEDTFASQSLAASIPAHERCEMGSDGVPIQPPEGETCRSITVLILGDDGGFSSLRQTGQTTRVRNVAGGQVYIETDWDLADGPNVTVRAHLPWGKYIYRCHHCTPGDSSITEFINSLHRFGRDRGLGDPNASKDDPVPVETTDTTDPNFTESTEFIPVGEEDHHDDEGLTEEEVALIGLVGLLGSIGLLGASLEGTGLTAADITNAIRRGDLTGGVGTPPEMLDEDGDPLFVNDGSYPEAPVGHVWWGTDKDEGRWVSPEDAQELVNEARAADTDLERDRAEALTRAREDWDADWEDLIRTSRAQAAADRMQAAMEREERATLIEGAAEARDAAAAANHEDLLDFMERNPLLTAEQIAAIFDAINRRGADQAALDAIPEVNVWREGVEGTLNDLADLADQAGRPEIAWMLRNPGVSVRVGAAVATGGYSEFVAVPIDITQRLQAAQERSLRENGRMMNNEELFGELGWALGTEAVYEVGGRLVGAGIGHVFSSGDEVIEAGIRELDEAGEAVARETTEEVSEAVSREASEAAERLGRSGDEVTGAAAREGTEEAAQAATREGTQEATEAATREGAEEATEAATREGTQEATEAAAREGAEEAAEAAARQAEELTPVPPKGNEGIANLETGARIPDEMMEQTGLPRRQLDDLETYARENDLNLTGRATNPHSAAALADGSAVGKPLDIKIKTGNDIDVLLGAKPHNRGVVTLFEPVMPPTKGMSPELVQALERRHAQRMAEWNKYKNTWTEGSERVAGFGGTQRTQRMVDGRLEVLYDGKWRKVGGDFDLVDMTRADGSPLSPAEFQRHVDGLIERGLIEHGGEVRVMTDIMRNNPHPPGSDEWMAAARETWALRESLENAQMAGEINIGINGTYGVHRAPDIDDFLPWKGGFEAPGGGLLTP